MQLSNTTGPGRWSPGKGHLPLIISVGLACIALAAPSWAAVAPVVATAILDPDGIRFQLADEDVRLLAVSGPDGFYEQQRSVGATAALSIRGEDGAAPVDGTYVWELRTLGAESGAPHTVRSGTFTVRHGQTLVAGGRVPEQPSPKGSVGGAPIPLAPTHFSDNVTIAGRMCVGDECQSSETMAFEAIKVKQNNAWIDIIDTSDPLAVDPFPSNDWRIKANDSSRYSVGGADYFAIEDRGAGSGTTKPFRIDAGASVDSIRVDQSGRVGIGTATPASKLHVMGNTTLEGDLSVLSSRSAKEGVTPVNAPTVLARLTELPLVEWSYTGRPEVRHLSPMAEDFHDAFPLGADERTVNPLDVAGVALAAIQGLQSELAAHRVETAQSLADRDWKIARLTAERDELARRLGALEFQVEAIMRVSEK